MYVCTCLSQLGMSLIDACAQLGMCMHIILLARGPCECIFLVSKCCIYMQVPLGVITKKEVVREELVQMTEELQFSPRLSVVEEVWHVTFGT